MMHGKNALKMTQCLNQTDDNWIDVTLGLPDNGQWVKAKYKGDRNVYLLKFEDGFFWADLYKITVTKWKAIDD